MQEKDYSSKITDDGLLISVFEEDPTSLILGQLVKLNLNNLPNEEMNENSKKIVEQTKKNTITNNILVSVTNEDKVLIRFARNQSDQKETLYDSKPLFGNTLIYELFDQFKNISIADEIIAYIKSKVKNTIEREETFEKIKNFVNVIAEPCHYNHEIPLDECKVISEKLCFLLAYTTPYLFRSKEELSLISSPYSLNSTTSEDWMFEPLISNFCDNILGSKNRTLRRIIHNLNCGQIFHAKIFSEFISADSIVEILEEIAREENSNVFDVEWCNWPVLNNFSDTVRKALIKDIIRGAEHVYDALDMSSLYIRDFKRFKGVKTIEELHDRASRLIPEVEEDIILENISDNFDNLSEFFIDDHKFEILMHLSDFVYTGKYLSICIGSATYFKNAIAGTSYCYTVKDKEDNLIGALQISKDSKKREWKVSQLYGRDNKLLPNDSILREGLKEIMNRLNGDTVVANDCQLV